MQGYLVRVGRLCFLDVEIDAPSPSLAAVGVMDGVANGSYPEEAWQQPPVEPRTIRLLGVREIAPGQHSGPDAFTTEPEMTAVDPDAIYEPDEPPIPYDGLEVTEEEDGPRIPADGLEVDDDEPRIPADGLPVDDSALEGLAEDEEVEEEAL